MVVGIAGRLEADLRTEIERLLGDLEPGDPGGPSPLQPLPNGAGPHVKVFNKQSDQAHLVLGVPSRPLDHPDRYNLQILATVLGGGMSSRLFTEVRERRGLAYTSTASITATPTRARCTPRPESTSIASTRR
jgi:predicted Zn-dependent peptidase